MRILEQECYGRMKTIELVREVRHRGIEYVGIWKQTGQSLGNSSVDCPFLPSIFLPEERQGRRGADMSNTDSIPTVNLSRRDQV